jgi:hypothetical protein
MSIRGEQQLRAQLGTALDKLTPGPLPLSAIVQQGRAVRARRRSIVAGVAAVIAAAAIAAPALLGAHGRRPPPASPAHYRVTVHPPGPGSSHALIAYGTVDGRPWRVTGSERRLGGHISRCFTAFKTNCMRGSPAPRASRGVAPAEQLMEIGTRPKFEIATVRSDVAYLRVSLTNSQTLTLRPVALFGRKYARYVAFAVPYAAAVRRVSAYSNHSELAYAVPLTAGGDIVADRWLRPGQPAMPRPASYKIGSGRAYGYAWSTTLYVGPWGACPVSSTARNGTRTVFTSCYLHPDLQLELAPGELVRVSKGPYLGNDRLAVIAQTSPAVSYLILTRADGSHARVGTVAAGRWRFCEYVTSMSVTGRPVSPVTVVRWTAFDSSGAVLGSGSPFGR